MSELTRITDQLRRGFEGEAWHGPALLEVLDGINAKASAARPIPNAHSIWDLTMHIQARERAALATLNGKPLAVSDEENFPPIGNATEADWRAAIATLRLTHCDLLTTVANLPEARLNQQVPGRDYDFYSLLHGLAQHALYHAGQIMLLKRAQAE